MEIRQLEHFVAVARERNFTRAAATLHLVQSAVSASVKSLEGELGFALFVRGPRSVELTSEGEAYLVAAQRVLDAADEARDVAAAVHGQVRGSLALGILAAGDLLGIPQLIAEFRRDHPDVRLTARTSPSGSVGLVDDLLSDALDLSVLVLPIAEHPALEVESLVGGRFVLAVGQTHPLADAREVTPAMLDGLEWVMTPDGFTSRRLLDRWLADQRIRATVSVEVSDEQIAAGFIHAGLGVGMVTAVAVAMTPGLRVLPVPGFDLRWGAGLGMRRGRRRTEAMRRLRAMVVERAAVLQARIDDGERGLGLPPRT